MNRRSKGTLRKIRKIKLGDIVKTRYQLFLIKRLLYSSYTKEGISLNKIKNIEIKFGMNKEFSKDSSSMYRINIKTRKNVILLKRKENVANTIGNIFHEIGHCITKYGDFGLFGMHRKNFIGETSAYSFEDRMLKVLYKTKKIDLSIKCTKIIKSFCYSPIHFISCRLRFIPLGFLIKEEYKNN